MNKMNNEMIPLTIANTLDQSMKTRVEVPDTTVKQAVKHANLAPKETMTSTTLQELLSPIRTRATTEIPLFMWEFQR